MDALENLGGLVSEVDQANPTPEQRQAQDDEQRRVQQLEEGAAEWAAIPYTIGNTLSILAPELKQVYTEKACIEWGACMHKVAEKYGWKAAGVPELALAAATINMAVPTALVMRHRLQLLREGQEAGMFGKLVLWWRQRRAAKAAAAAGADKEQESLAERHG